MIKVVENQKYDNWSIHLSDFDYSLFITSHWLESLKTELQIPVYLDFIQDGYIIAKTAGLFIRKKGTISSKIFFYAGPAIKDSYSREVVQDCLTALYSYGIKTGFNRIVILSYDYPNASHRHPKFTFRRRSEFVLDLTKEKHDIDHSISRNIKRSVKKALSLGYVIKESSEVKLTNQLILLMEETKRVRISKGYSDYNFFYLPLSTKMVIENLIKCGLVKFYCVEKNGKNHAILTVMMHDQHAYGMFIGASEEGYNDGAPSLIDYSIIHLLKDRNFKYINFGGIPVDKSHEGLIGFKRKLGCEEKISVHGSTNFLQFPYLLLNPAINIARILPDNRIIKFLIKNHVN